LKGILKYLKLLKNIKRIMRKKIVLDSYKNLHVMDLPKRVVVGKNVLLNITKYLDSIVGNLNYVSIVTGPNIYRSLINRLVDHLEINYKVYIAKESTWSELTKIEEKIVLDGLPDIIIGFGGGKSIDIAKLISYRNGIPFVSIPTSPSHDGIASLFASIRGDKKAFSLRANPPLLVLVELDIIANAPPRLIASGVGDALAKFTAVADWRLSHEETGEYFGEYSSNLALMSAKLVLDKIEGISQGDEYSIRTLMEALISTGVAAGIAGSSRPCSGSEHLFSHAMDIYVRSRSAYHGEQVGVGTIMMSFLHGFDWEGIKQAIESVGGPTNYKELRISREDVILALKMAKKVRPERYTILNKYRMSHNFAEKIARKTGVI